MDIVQLGSGVCGLVCAEQLDSEAYVTRLRAKGLEIHEERTEA